jgi:hypothetical protein
LTTLDTDVLLDSIHEVASRSMGLLERLRIWDDPVIRDALAWYIARDNVDAADRRIAGLFAAFETLAQSLGIGHARGSDAVAAIVLGGSGVSGDLSRRALAG